MMTTGRRQPRRDHPSPHGFECSLDRAHVLASGYMDRHWAYTGLTRHRDGVALHYGRDEFADAAALARVLCRDRAKNTSLDYGGASTPHSEVGQVPARELAQGYAVRHGLTPKSSIVVRPAPVAAPAPQPQHQLAAPEVAPARWGMCAGLKLGTGPIAGRAPQASAAAKPPGGPAWAEDVLLQVVGRLAAGVQDAVRMREQDLPVLAHQHQALLDARVVLIAAAEAVQARRQEAAWRAGEQERKRWAALARRAELNPLRAQVLEGRLEAWWRTEKKPGAAAWSRSWVPAAEVAAVRVALSQQVEALPDAELWREAAEWAHKAQQEHAARQEQAAQQARSSPSMRP